MIKAPVGAHFKFFVSEIFVFVIGIATLPRTEKTYHSTTRRFDNPKDPVGQSRTYFKYAASGTETICAY